MDTVAQRARSSTESLRHLYRFMAQRSFVASREELLDAGFSLTRVRNWLRTGRLVTVVRGVYSYGRDVESSEAVFRAALLAVGSGSVLTGSSAAEAWRIIDRPTNRLPLLVEIAVVDGKARRLPGLSPALRQTSISVVHRRLEPGDVRRRGGLDLVKPGLALVDLAVNASEREVRFAFLEACRLSLFGRKDVDDCYRRIAGRRGATKLRPLLALWVPELKRTRSVFEGSFLLAWAGTGWPMPKVNEKVHGYEVDCYWPEQQVVLELDGAAFHSDPVQRAIDAAKQNALEAAGLTVLRATYQAFEANPKATLDRVGRALCFR